MINGEVVKGLQPELVWKHLAEIAEIPRGSGNEEGARAYVLSVALKYGLQSKIDAVGNLLVKKPATVGHENVPSIALQGHLDMVCEKNADVAHDFLKDPIRFVQNGDIIKANGTTAGFDNGIAVAVMCAIMEETTLAHGPLEMLFTIDEETGLSGANGLEKDFLESKTLINLDTEEEGQLYIGCAGGKQITGIAKYSTREPPVGSLFYTLQVSGLRGGHSGCDIHENRGNALKIIGNILDTMHDMNDVLFVSVFGGDKHNAIPREAEA
jgi:dipeptidase D